jgi:hypothetical protein
MKKIAILSGTSGMIGMQLLHCLIQDKSYDMIISVGRRKLALKHEKLVQVETDLGKIRSMDLESKLRESDIGGVYFPLIADLKNKSLEIHAFCTLGTTIKAAGSKENFHEIEHDYVLNFALWANGLGAN